MEAARQITPDIHILPTFYPLPVLGGLAVNAYVLKAAQPVLIDTGLGLEAEGFMRELEGVIDPAEIRWLWLTHPDIDHVGSLQTMLARSPEMRVITTFLGYGIYTLSNELPLDRVYFLNPGQSLDVGDRQLTAWKPPVFDNPATTALYDTKSGTLFSSDCFGGLLSEPVEDARDISDEALFQGQVTWATIDSPWLHKVDASKFAAELDGIRQMAPKRILSSHLPPAEGMTDRLLKSLAATPDATPFVGPDQVALEAMLAQMTDATHAAAG